MTNEEKILLGIKALGFQDTGSFIAIVDKNYPDSDYVDVKNLSGTLYPGVRKRASIKDDKSDKQGFIITPVEGSYAIVSRIDQSDELYISMFSDIESMVIDGGENLGLVKIQDLTSKLNELVKTVNDLIAKFNTHTHQVTTTGSATTQTGTTVKPGTEVTKAKEFNKSDYENEKFKH